MSELKRFDIVGKYTDEETMYEFRPDGECYDADEADKVIRHNKYKRCLAMAKWCFTRSNFFFVVGRNEGGRFAEERFRRSRLYSKWHKRWLKIAGQFKEARND